MPHGADEAPQDAQPEIDAQHHEDEPAGAPPGIEAQKDQGRREKEDLTQDEQDEPGQGLAQPQSLHRQRGQEQGRGRVVLLLEAEEERKDEDHRERAAQPEDGHGLLGGETVPGGRREAEDKDQQKAQQHGLHGPLAAGEGQAQVLGRDGQPRRPHAASLGNSPAGPK
ncbi:hypothetical protein DSECCO2_652200 [anaerobic digester metagenome]